MAFVSVSVPYDCLVLGLFPYGCLSWNKTQTLVLALAVGLDDLRDFFPSLNDSMSIEIPSRLNSL